MDSVVRGALAQLLSPYIIILMPTFLAKTKNGLNVYVDLQGSHAATHLADTPGLLELVKEALLTLAPSEDDVYTEVDLGRIIGTSDLVETTKDDDVFYAKRLNRTNYTRFVRGREPVKTSIITLVFHRQNNGYLLYSAWVGWAAPPFPQDEKETPESRGFWKSHALVWGRQAIQQNTEQDEWPWS